MGRDLLEVTCLHLQMHSSQQHSLFFHCKKTIPTHICSYISGWSPSVPASLTGLSLVQKDLQNCGTFTDLFWFCPCWLTSMKVKLNRGDILVAVERFKTLLSARISNSFKSLFSVILSLVPSETLSNICYMRDF